MNIPDGYTLVYLDGPARVSHVLAPNKSANLGAPALCGRQPDPFADWFGTGEQREYEEAKRRMMCLFCASALRRQGH